MPFLPSIRLARAAIASWLIFGPVSIFASTTEAPALRSRQSSCSTVPGLQLTTTNWNNAQTDAQFNSWWNDPFRDGSGQKPTQLAAQYGSHISNFQCGVGILSTCTTQSCDGFTADFANIWSYFVINSIVNLNTFFNEIYSGVTTGQIDYVGLTGLVAEDFFPWKEPVFLPDSFIIWIVAGVTAIASFGALSGVEEGVAAVAFGSFLAAAGQQITLSLSPDLTRTEGIAQLGSFATQTAESTRQALEQWVNSTFNGQADDNGHTLKDYLAGGSFVALNLPSNYDVEEFYKQQMLARTINLGWKTSHAMVFIMFANTTDADDAHGPSETKYYSEGDGGVYYLYNYVENGKYKGYLGTPPALDRLNSSTYNLNITDAVKSSARAWQFAGNNYTDQDVRDRIIASVSSNGALTPFQDGPAWEGVWTIPVCDIGNNVQWNTQFGEKLQGYGRLPCCCGPDCKDTADFVEAAGWKGYQTLLTGCKHQLAGSGINFEDIDYGFKMGKSFDEKWAVWSDGQKAGVVIGLIFGIVVGIGALTCMCGGCD